MILAVKNPLYKKPQIRLLKSHLSSFASIYIYLKYIMAQKNVTLSLDEAIYSEYKEYCKRNAIALSKSIELFMEKKLKEDE
jgi:hypothetical protein